MENKTLCTLCLWMLVCMPGAGDAELYQWVDKNGVVHYSNTMVTNEKETMDEEHGLKILNEKTTSPAPDPKPSSDATYETETFYADDPPYREQVEKSETDRAGSVEELRESLKMEIAHFNREIKNNEEKLELTHIELESATARYDEIKRESYSSTATRKKKLQQAESKKMRYENRIETIKRSIQDYKDLIRANEQKLAKLPK